MISGASPRKASMLGAVLGGYRITAALSIGGMGTVYRAEHELLGRPAAIKFLHTNKSTEADLVERFFLEARAASAIQHPGIVDIYDFGYTGEGRPYLVMELLEGATLAKRLAERTRFGARDVATIAASIASALRAAHEKDIVHRDLKPDNIFLVADTDIDGIGRVKILDFGVAKLLTSQRTMTLHGALMGTPQYMAPEQARTAHAIDHRADLYSLGCILYELLVGRPPFVAEGAGEIIAMQMFQEPEAPSARVPGIPPALDALVLRLLAKEPGDRPQSAAAVMEALQAIDHTAPPARSSSPPARSSSPPVMRPRSLSTVSMIAAVLTLLIAAAVIAILMRRTSARPVAPTPTSPAATAPVAPTTPTTPTPVVTPTTTPAATAPAPATAPSTTKPAKPARPARPAPTPPPAGPTTPAGSPIEPSL